MLVKALVHVLAERRHKSVLAKEKEIGYRINIPIPKNWVEGVMMCDMTNTFNKHGLNVTATNYFTIGGVQDGRSTRYDPSSPYYQAWLGGYMVKFFDDAKWSIVDHGELARADQLSWLKTYQVNTPIADIDTSSVEHLETTKVGDYEADIYKGIIHSCSDVGKRGHSFMFTPLMHGLAYIFNKNLPMSCKLTKKSVIPNWNEDSPIDSFHNVTLTGYVSIVKISPFHRAVLYANGAAYTDRNGKFHDTFPNIKDELLAALKGTQIVKI
ncbi:MAG: hypothetical protein R3B92_04555 [Patescibacteria group bacterium]